MRTSQPADQSVTGARSGGQVPAFAALSRYRARATLHEYSHPSAYRAFPQAAQRRLRLRGNICAPTVATAQPMRASNHIPVAKICARIENINEVWFYDADGRTTKTQVSYPGSGLATVTLSYAYDAYGNRTYMSDSLSANFSYAYNANNQLTSIVMNSAMTLVTLAYDSQNRLSTVTMSSGTGHSFSGTYSWDTVNRLTGITYKDTTTNTTMATFSYTLNAASQITNYAGPDGSLTYTYDHAGQLTGVSGAHNETFGYDGNGNRNTTGYTVGTGNQITTDPAGNTLNYLGGNLSTKTDSSGNVWTYTFDFHNRLTQVVEKNSGGTTIFTENMTYDVFGNLIGDKVNGTQQRWTVFDGSNPYIDFSGSGSVTRRYVMDPTALDRFFATVASNVPTWLFTDNLGSIREVVSKTGSVLDQITYGAFGNILSQTNSSNAPRFLYAGGEWDGNLGLYHFGARWDDPVDGRWISQDPLGLGSDSDPYRYVYNDPIMFSDPEGLQTPGSQPTPRPANNPIPTLTYIAGLNRQLEAANTDAAMWSWYLANIDPSDGQALWNLQMAQIQANQLRLSISQAYGWLGPGGA